MVKRFAGDERGGVALLFGLAVIPLVALIGTAIDYSRSTRAQADLQAAVDGAALAAGKSAIEQNRKDLARLARTTFDATFRPDGGVTVTAFDLSQNAARIAVEAQASVPTMFGGFLGRATVALKARAEVPVGFSSIELALVLDNTGSMAQNGKIAALKEAARNLIATIETSPGSINSRIALVPFNSQVNVGEENRNAAWLRFELPSLVGRAGAGSAGAGGLGWGGGGSFSGSGVPASLAGVIATLWKGCVADRDQPYDVQATLPTVGRPESLHPAALCQYPGLQKVMPLSRDFFGLKQSVDRMAPVGNTNTGIGLAWGLSVLMSEAPLGPARTSGNGLERTIVFLTDGQNTENRWTKDQAAIDRRTEALCDEIRNQKIKLYTVRVVEGNETLLRNCATNPSMYFSVSRASELKDVFDRIALDLTTLRLSY